MELYYRQPILTECTAKVLSCAERDGRYAIELDRSIIFPEGGGQLSDSGQIDDAIIFEAKTEKGHVIHFCSKPFDEGSDVTLRLNVSARLDHTAQHTGEHIISGLASKLFNAHNVGFHMAKEYCTVDFDIFLDQNQLTELQLAANAAVTSNLPITTELVSGKEAASRPLRKLADKLSATTEDVRIVYIDNGNIDSCTCCGTHFQHTGEVGAILITDSQKYKGGIRCWFACGERAIRHAISCQSELSALAQRFSTSREELPSAVQKLRNDLSACKQEIKSKSDLLTELLSTELLSGIESSGSTGYIVKRFDTLSPADLKALSDKLITKTASPLAALLFCNTPSGTEYRMVCTDGLKLSMRDLCSAVNAAINGKGGGSSSFAQGKTSKSVSDDDIDMLEHYLSSVLSAL